MKDIPVIFGKEGRTTIPLPLRRRLDWQAGDTIRFRLDGDRVIITRDRPQAQNKAAPSNPAGAVLPFIVALLLGGADEG
jgi:bifunctional DNA-binding transcriptional regulator/antitoxin component of YhaV-PrlF toxin-antitoxin module